MDIDEISYKKSEKKTQKNVQFEKKVNSMFLIPGPE